MSSNDKPGAGQDRTPDLGETFRNFVTNWERDFNSFANQVMGTETFSRAMNTAQKSQLGMQQLFSDAMARHFAAMNMPSRDDVVQLGETLQDVVRRLERIEAQLAEGLAQRNAGANGPAPQGPPRTKQPPADYMGQRPN